jgi:hypothetical protein
LTPLVTLLVLSTLTSCGDAISRFNDGCTATEDGFVYYNRYTNDGAHIVELPDVEELVIPEYLNNEKVKGIGYRYTELGYVKYYLVVSENTKKLTIQHQFLVQDMAPHYYADFPNLKTLVFIDFLYCNAVSKTEELLVTYHIGKADKSKLPNVELRKTNREFSLDEFISKTILIPDYVKIIETDVFAALIDVVIKTTYESQPVGWQDGWNGNCEVEWGAEIKYN